MKKIVIIFFAFLQLSSFSQKTDRDNAKAAFMEIIECYFRRIVINFILILATR